MDVRETLVQMMMYVIHFALTARGLFAVMVSYHTEYWKSKLLIELNVDVERQLIIFGIVHVRRLYLVYGGKENRWTYVKFLFKMMGSITTKEIR